MDEIWVAIGASLGVGLLIGLERERHPQAKAGARTFALLALLGALAALVGERTQSAWLLAVGLAAVAAMLVAAEARDASPDDPGTTTVAAACVCYLLGGIAGLGEPRLAGALGIGVTALLYFKSEIEGLSRMLERHEQVSVLQFLVASFIVLPILPDEAFGPYGALNPRNVWLMVVLITGIGLASHVVLRVVGPRGVIVAGILGGLVSSTATTVLYARRSAQSPSVRSFAAVVVPLANLVPLARVALLAALLAPALLPFLAPVLGAALAAGVAVTALGVRADPGGEAPPVPESRNPAELATALRFAGFYALVLLATAWLSDIGGERGLYATATLSGFIDVDPIVLSSLNFFDRGQLAPAQAVAAIATAYAANVAFKLGVLFWYDRRLALRATGPLLATIAGGGAAYAWLV